MITLRLRHILLFTITLLLTACQFEDDSDCPKDENIAASYINLTIAVSNGNTHNRTRAGEIPTAGEDGDGREAGFERENAVTGITLILYKLENNDNKGINTTTDPTLDLVRYFPVTKGTEDVSSPIEAYYTTGDQPIGRPNLDFSGTYHAIVIANQVLPAIKEGTSHLSDLRDNFTSIIYSGDPSMDASSCVNFVMTSEKDNTINFGVAEKTEDAAGDKHYDLSKQPNQPLIIERMAARIDFWSANSNGYKTTENNAAYTIPGYEYNVTSSNDKFVVTGVVPFNLTNGHTDYGSEYLLKRIRTDISDATTTSYLADETATTYVIDPKTDIKLLATTPNLTSSLANVYTLIGDASKLENTTDNPYYHSISSMHGSATASSTIESKENVVVCYPMENCILPQSKLFYHATGIAIVGYYYKNGMGTGTRYVYLGYLRHQGEYASYDIQPYTIPLVTDATMGTTTAMNFGIVRNNIYRVSINSIDKKGDDTPKVTLQIKVKKWDKFEHEPIYM